MVDDKIGYNSAYVSLNLLDELDYCIGGYGKPNIEFLFSLNTFVETFIGSSEFYTSLDELNHLNLTAPAIFPNGRPILNLVVRECGLKFVNGIVDNPRNEIYREYTFPKTRKEAQQNFIIEYGKKIHDRYFIKSGIDNIIEKIPLITSTFEDDEFIVSETLSTSSELVANLMGVSHSSSIQTSLPLYLYDRQLSSLNALPYSIYSLERVAELHDANLDDLKASLNYQYLPIPPFTNILLSQVSSIVEIPQKLSQLRADFQELRDKFVALEENIYGSQKIKDQLDALKEFKDFWSAFNKKYVNKKHRIFYGSMEITKDGDIDKAGESLIDGSSVTDAFKDVNITKIAGNIIKKGLDWYQDKKIINRFKGLTNIWELFLDSQNLTQQLSHFERLFSVKFDISEVNRVHGFVKTKLTDIRKNIR